MAEKRLFIPKSDILEVTTRFIKTKDLFHYDKEYYELIEGGYRLKSLNGLILETNSNRNNTIINYGTAQKLGSKRDNFGTTSGQEWGFYSEQFDEVMRESPVPQDKRVIAETIGLKVTSDTFRKLLARRTKEGKVRYYRGSPNLIEWVNRDYKVTQLSSTEKQAFLDIKLPLSLNELVAIPPGSVVGVAGFVSSGKTSLLLETAELNALSQLMPVYYWYNEMSEAKLIIRCEDFPLLIDAQNQGRFFPVKQVDFEIADVIEPDGINIIDYLDRDDELYLIGRDIKQLQARLNNGIVVFALQKQHGNKFGYGGLPSAKLSNLYIALDKVEEQRTSLRGKAEIIKCKDWEEVNPVGMFCEYRTGGKHGKLFMDGEWKRKKNVT